MTAPEIPAVPLDSPTIAAVIHRQASGAAALSANISVVANLVTAWNKLMPYGWTLEAQAATKDRMGVLRCDVKLRGPSD